MTNDSVIAAALESLAGVRHAHSDAIQLVPKEPGLYAFYGDDHAWSGLGLSPAFEGQPLYVGKAERSLNGRDVRTHFAVGKTGSSTVRRSLAALLGSEFGLVAVPRNPAKPDGSANFGLDPASEACLSDWMEQRLSMATWTQPGHATLDDVETAVLRRLRPPLNLDKVGEPRERLRQARRRMADIARAWRPSDNVGPTRESVESDVAATRRFGLGPVSGQTRSRRSAGSSLRGCPLDFECGSLPVCVPVGRRGGAWPKRGLPGS